MIITGFSKEIKRRLKEKTLKFVGFCSEEQAKKLKKKYVCIITDTPDLISKIFNTPQRNVYVYKEVTK